MRRALRNCAGSECYNLVGNGRTCPAHPPRAPWASTTTSRQARGYGAEHDAMRKRVMAEEPACALCGSEADARMDHIIPLSEGGTTTRENTRRLCEPCHTPKTQAEARRALLRAKARHKIDPDSGRES